jgi:hypothetical protein
MKPRLGHSITRPAQLAAAASCRSVFPCCLPLPAPEPLIPLLPAPLRHRYGYGSLVQVQQVVANYSNAELPLESMWLDIDYSEWWATQMLSAQCGLGGCTFWVSFWVCLTITLTTSVGNHVCAETRVCLEKVPVCRVSRLHSVLLQGARQLTAKALPCPAPSSCLRRCSGQLPPLHL